MRGQESRSCVTTAQDKSMFTIYFNMSYFFEEIRYEDLAFRLQSRLSRSNLRSNIYKARQESTSQVELYTCSNTTTMGNDGKSSNNLRLIANMLIRVHDVWHYTNGTLEIWNPKLVLDKLKLCCHSIDLNSLIHCQGRSSVWPEAGDSKVKPKWLVGKYILQWRSSHTPSQITLVVCSFISSLSSLYTYCATQSSHCVYIINLNSTTFSWIR